MIKPKRRATTMLTVDTGPDHRARFYVLQVGGRGSDRTVREDLLVVDGDELKTTHRHENLDEAA
jgi:hypothetical protein